MQKNFSQLNCIAHGVPLRRQVMRKIMYEDGNNNATFLKELFVQVQALSNSELNWRISNLDFIPIDKGDFIDGIPSDEMEEIYYFQKKALEKQTIILTHNALMELLENIRTIYEGDFAVCIEGEQLKIKIFDGDIIEMDGEMENELKL